MLYAIRCTPSTHRRILALLDASPESSTIDCYRRPGQTLLDTAHEDRLARFCALLRARDLLPR